MAPCQYEMAPSRHRAVPQYGRGDGVPRSLALDAATIGPKARVRPALRAARAGREGILVRDQSRGLGGASSAETDPGSQAPRRADGRGRRPSASSATWRANAKCSSCDCAARPFSRTMYLRLALRARPLAGEDGLAMAATLARWLGGGCRLRQRPLPLNDRPAELTTSFQTERSVSVQIHPVSSLVGLSRLAALSLQGGPDGPRRSDRVERGSSSVTPQ